MFDPELVQKYNKPVPRYITYPTADRFVDTYDASAHETTLRERNALHGLGATKQPLALYVHIPFCNTLCYYCTCSKVITADHSSSAAYLRCLEREIGLTASLLPGNRCAAQVHLGGGTPTFLSARELETLMLHLGRHFELLPGEYAIEIDPRTVDDEKIAALAKLGFNYLSLGIQDFDPDVQAAVNRPQSEAETARAMAAARREGIKSINVDLIYGLPRQTEAGFRRTLDRVVSMRPDRIAMYEIVHAPTTFESQRHIDAAALPDMAERMRILAMAIRLLTDAGYVYIGLDHFALPHDELAVAARRAGLHRNFQGFSTRPESDLIAFGMSAISKIGATYSQNAATLDDYCQRVERGLLPVARGMRLAGDDLVRRTVIQALMCHFELSIESIELAYHLKFRDYFAAEWDKLESMERDGLITIEPEWITVTPRGRLLVRSVAMVFDRALDRHESTGTAAREIR